MPIGTNFNPASVMMKQGGIGQPYIGIGQPRSRGSVGPVNAGTFNSGPMPGKGGSVGPISAGQHTDGNSPASGNVLGPESVRATGAGPFDPAYRQNLATYGGGMYARPGGSMNFNPTDMSTFPGQPTGGGNAPVSGMPLSLMDMALGGQPFSFAPQQPPSQPSIQPNPNFKNPSDWLNEFWKNGRAMRAMA